MIPQIPICIPRTPMAARPRTKELFAATALLDDFDQTGLELLDGGNVVRENAHLAGLGRNVARMC